MSRGFKSGDELVTIEGRIETTTAKAVLIDLTNGEQVWMPKSQIHSQTKISDDGLHEFEITEWIAKKNNLA